MSDIAIKAQGLGKKYSIRHQGKAPYQTIREAVVEKFKGIWGHVPNSINFLGGGNLARVPKIPSTEDFWAIKDVSFEVKRGECVGIIGRNGAGKSTLLKVLSRITDPTAGRVELRGRVASLLEVGTGFHQELTGRENIYLNGTILGMTKREIDKKFDEIVAFAEIEKFLDTPVKRYSSGMYVRLAFAVAAHLEPEILVVDEVLAVGDAEFQRKCLGKMKAVGQTGRTVLFVSHNMAAIKALSSRCLLVDHGQKVADDDTGIVVGRYNEILRGVKIDENTGIYNDKLRRGEGAIRFTGIEMLNAKAEPCISFKYAEKVCFRMSYKIFKSMEGVRLYIGLKSGVSGEVVTSAQHILSSERLLPGACGDVVVEIPGNDILKPGEYPLYFHLSDIKVSSSSIDVVDEATPPLIIQDDPDVKKGGCFNLPSVVTLNKIEACW